ncbi:hypothetical protein Hanom_Chr16g01455801 [Helianthus anomalus]
MGDSFMNRSTKAVWPSKESGISPDKLLSFRDVNCKEHNASTTWASNNRCKRAELELP